MRGRASCQHFARAWPDPEPDDLKRVKDAIDAFSDTGGRLRRPYHLSLLARLCGRMNEPEQALAVVEQASVAALQNHERWWDAELHRLRGDLMLARGAAATDAEAAYHRAIEIARTQGARSLELRAAMSLARLHHEGRTASGATAPAALVAVYDQFTEGLDTPDLRAASDLLAP